MKQQLPTRRYALHALDAKVEVDYDRWGVPTIRARHDDDVWRGQGFVTALDRLAQMEYLRRAARGELAAVLGENFFDHDLKMRRLDLNRVVASLYRNQKPHTLHALECYADGVCAAMAQVATEAPIFGGRAPRPWLPADSISIARLMALQLAYTADAKRRMTDRMTECPAAAVYDLTAALPGSAILDTGAAPVWPWEGDAPAQPLCGEHDAGSNNWAVASRRAARGAPLLCSDPHLALTSPSVWYEARLQCHQFRAAGATIPGMPGVIIGHTDRVAWGVTNVGADVTDVVRVPRDHQDAHCLETTSTIEVAEAGGVSQTDIVVKHHRVGTVIDEDEEFLYCARWTGFHHDDDQGAFLQLNRTPTFRHAWGDVCGFGVPAQNFVFAGTSPWDEIGYRAAGRFPIRAAPCPGMADIQQADEWQGFLDPDDWPQCRNPNCGYIVTANNPPVDSAYPHYLGVEFDVGYRASRIRHLLDSLEAADLEDMMTVQTDVHVPDTDVAWDLITAGETTHANGEAVAALRRWDRRAEAEAVGPTIFFAWQRELARALMSPSLPDAWIDQTLNNDSAVSRLLARVLNGGARHDWLGERSLSALSAHAWTRAVEWLESRFGANIEAWRWGLVHQARLDPVPGVDAPTHTLPRRGGLHSVDVAGFPPEGEDWTVTSGPSYRLCVSMEERPRAVSILPGAQGAECESQLDRWATGRYKPLTPAPAPERRVILAPGG